MKKRFFAALAFVLGLYCFYQARSVEISCSAQQCVVQQKHIVFGAKIWFSGAVKRFELGQDWHIPHVHPKKSEHDSHLLAPKKICFLQLRDKQEALRSFQDYWHSEALCRAGEEIKALNRELAQGVKELQWRWFDAWPWLLGMLILLAVAFGLGRSAARARQ